MNNSTPYFPQLRAQCAPLGAQIERAGAATDSIVGLAALFGGDFAGLLVPAKKGTGSRQRELPRVAVFWAFLCQVLMRGASCRWALTRLQADVVSRGRQPPGSGTGAYCQARRARRQRVPRPETTTEKLPVSHPAAPADARIRFSETVMIAVFFLSRGLTKRHSVQTLVSVVGTPFGIAKQADLKGLCFGFWSDGTPRPQIHIGGTGGRRERLRRLGSQRLKARGRFVRHSFGEGGMLRVGRRRGSPVRASLVR